MAKEEVKEKENFTDDLGITFDFGSTEEIGEQTGDDDLLLEDAAAKADENLSAEEKALLKTPPGTDIDINKEFENLFDDDNKNKLDNPAIVDDKTTTKGKATETGDKGEKPSDSLTVAYAKILQEQGLSDFNEEEYLKSIEEKGEAEAFVDLLDKNAKLKADTYVSTLDNYSKEYVTYREAGFTQQEATTLIGNKESINAITTDQIEKDEELQENIIKEVSTLRGIGAEEIKEQIQLLKDTDKLKDRATQNLTGLQTYYTKLADQELLNKQNTATLQKEADDKYITDLKTDINGTDEIIKDRKINQQTKDKIYNLITTPVKLKNDKTLSAMWAKRAEDPKAFDKKLAYFIVTGLFDGQTKTLTTDAKTKALAEIKKGIDSGRTFSTGEALLENNTNQTIDDKAKEMEEFLTT